MTTGLAFDVGVPQRDRLLDCEAMHDHLARFTGGSTPGLPSLARVKYQPGRSLRVVYRFPGDDDTPAIVTCRTFPSAQTRFWKFPADRRLQEIGALLRPAEYFTSHFSGAWTRSRLAAYSPEKSAVVACVSADGQTFAYAKQYAARADAAAAECIQHHVFSALRRTKPLGVPQVVDRSEASHVVFSDVAAGTPMTALEGPAFVDAAGLLGAALARLHAIPIPSHLLNRAPTPAVSLMDAVSLIALVQPWHAERARRAAETLEARVPAASRPVLLHGDVHLKNAFVHEDAVTLIDLDQASVGSPAIDIGSVLALFRSRVATAMCSENEANAFVAHFLTGYARVRMLPPDAEINWHAAAALLTERSLRAISRIRLPLLLRLDILLDDAWRLAGLRGAA